MNQRSLGKKRKLVTLIDDTATVFDTIFVSAGRGDLEIELSPIDLRSLLTKGLSESIGKIAQRVGYSVDKSGKKERAYTVLLSWRIVHVA